MKRRQARALLFSILFILAVHLGVRRRLERPGIDNGSSNGNELLTVYDVAEGVAPAYLKPIDVDRDWIPRPTPFPIDMVHRRGWLHTGHWMFLVDGHDRVLFLKRQPSLVTCPNTWMVLGEHSKPTDAEPVESAKRGIQEELGSAVLDEHVDFIRPLEPIPLYYERDYGPTNGGRIDRQAVYNWWVQLKKDVDGNQLEMNLDDEVAAVRWLTLSELDEWIEEDWKLQRKQSTTGDPAFEGRLCHLTILELLQAALADLKEHLLNRVSKRRSQQLHD